MNKMTAMRQALGEEKVGGFIDSFVFPEGDFFGGLFQLWGLYKNEFKTDPKVRMDLSVKDGDVGLQVSLSPIPKANQKWLTDLFGSDRKAKALGKKMTLRYDGDMAILVPTGNWTVTKF